MTQPVFRFAPSPNGRLHLGHACSALLNAQFAAAWSGRLLLRIEDIDRARCRLGFEAAIRDDLAWLGLVWEEPVRRQSEHLLDYAAALGRLRANNFVYPCFCTRQAVSTAIRACESVTGRATTRDPDGVPLYPGTCRALAPDETARLLAAGAPAAWRLAMDRALVAVGSAPLAFVRFDAQDRGEPVTADPARWGDPILARRDIATSYHLSVVVDDALQGVTHVVRGRDLEAATDLQVVLQRLLALPTPRYHHHALILDGSGRKLSKSAGSEPLADLRARGVSPTGIRERLGFAPQPTPST